MKYWYFNLACLVGVSGLCITDYFVNPDFATEGRLLFWGVIFMINIFSTLMAWSMED